MYSFILLYHSVFCYFMFCHVIWFSCLHFTFIFIHTIWEETMDFKRDNENFIEMYINEPDFSGNGKRRSQRKWSIYYLWCIIIMCMDFNWLCQRYYFSMSFCSSFYVLSFLYFVSWLYFVLRFILFMWFNLCIYIHILFVTLFTELALHHTSCLWHISLSSIIRKVRHISFNPTGTIYFHINQFSYNQCYNWHALPTLTISIYSHF